jgi:hypothetical protein
MGTMMKKISSWIGMSKINFQPVEPVVERALNSSDHAESPQRPRIKK